MTQPLTVSLHENIADIGQTDWDACADPTGAARPVDPFVTFRFLSALEHSGSVGNGTGWHPRYLQLRQGDMTIGVAPLYIKSHSQGEYVFDHGWAQAYEQAGGRYYPKCQIAVPFTPVSGRRLLVRDGFDDPGVAGLMQGAVNIAADNGLSSLHITFCTPDEARAGQSAGLLMRTGQQFHWENAGYQSFDDFLNALSSRKRKMIRKERAEAQGFGGQIVQLTGDAITSEHWSAMWQFYQDTGSRKWGVPYLTRAAFDAFHDTMRDDILLVLALRDDGTPIAGALNFIGSKVLFGRYWGCIEHHPFLHFEICYYQAIEYAIARGLRVEAGAQGEHKLARGYLPHKTYSLHWIADQGFRRAVSDFVTREQDLVDEDIEILTSYGPFRRTHETEQD